MTPSAQMLSQRKRWRGMIIELAYDGHRKQESRLDDLTLWGMMRDLGQDIGQRDVLTLIQDLGQMQYLCFRQQKNDFSGQVRIYEIELTPRGLALAEREAKDPLVHVLL